MVLDLKRVSDSRKSPTGIYVFPVVEYKDNRAPYICNASAMHYISKSLLQGWRFLLSCCLMLEQNKGGVF